MDLAAALGAAQGPTPTTRPGIVRAAPAANRVVVEVDRVNLSLPYVTGTYAVGDTVLVRDGYVLGRVGAPAVVPPAPPPPPVPTKSQHTQTVLPQTTGTYRGGKWRDTTDLYQGDFGGYGLNTGAAYYGDQLVALRADLGQPRSAKLTYHRQRGGDYAAQAPTLWSLTERVRGGAPGRAASYVGAAVAVDATVEWPVPAALLDELLSGTRGGLGLYIATPSPYIVLDGLADDAAAFALSVTYYA